MGKVTDYLELIQIIDEQAKLINIQAEKLVSLLNENAEKENIINVLMDEMR